MEPDNSDVKSIGAFVTALSRVTASSWTFYPIHESDCHPQDINPAIHDSVTCFGKMPDCAHRNRSRSGGTSATQRSLFGWPIRIRRINYG